MSDSQQPESKALSVSYSALLINVLTSPEEAFEYIKNTPSKLFPLGLVIALNGAMLFWYFNIVDYAWYVDDILSTANIDDDQLDAAREGMQSMSRSMFMILGIIASTIGLTLICTIQSGYLSLVSSLRGDNLRFSQWFSLVAWSGIPFLASIIGMTVTLLLNQNGQLSAYDLDPLTFRNLGFTSDNESVQALFASINLPMIWSFGLLMLGHQQWLGSSWAKTIITVAAPYLLILGVWAIIAFQ